MASTAPFTILHEPRLEAYVSGGLNVTVYNDGPTTCALHYLVLDAASDVPSTGFTSGTNYGTMPVAARSSFDVPLSDLPAGTYRFHAYFSSVGNSAVASSAALTVLHTPRFGTPVVSGTSATIAVSNDAAVAYNFFYKVLAAAEDVPSVFDITSGGFDGLVSVDAGATENVVLSDFSGGAYRFYGLFGASDGSPSAVSGTDPFTILHAPVFDALMVSGADLTLTVQNGGASTCTLHYSVFAATANALAPGFTTGDHYGTVAVPASDTADVSVPGLSEGAYRLHGYFSLADAASVVVRSDEFTVAPAAPDPSTPPVFVGAAYAVAAARAVATVRNDAPDARTLYYTLVVASEAAPTTPADITGASTPKGTVRISAGSAQEIELVAADGLTAGLSYRFFAFFRSDAAVDSALNNTLFFLVPTPPQVSGPEVLDDGAVLLVSNRNNFDFTLHWVTLLSSASAPSTAAVETATTLSGSLALATGRQEGLFIDGLVQGQAYRTHLFFQSATLGSSAVFSSEPFLIPVTLPLPPRPPVILGVEVDALVSGRVNVRVANDGSSRCALYYLIAPLSAPPEDKKAIVSRGRRSEVETTVSLLSHDISLHVPHAFYAFFALAGRSSRMVVSGSFTFFAPTALRFVRPPTLGMPSYSVPIGCCSGHQLGRYPLHSILCGIACGDPRPCLQ